MGGGIESESNPPDDPGRTAPGTHVKLDNGDNSGSRPLARIQPGIR